MNNEAVTERIKQLNDIQTIVQRADLNKLPRAEAAIAEFNFFHKPIVTLLQIPQDELPDSIKASLEHVNSNLDPHLNDFKEHLSTETPSSLSSSVLESFQRVSSWTRSELVPYLLYDVYSGNLSEQLLDRMTSIKTDSEDASEILEKAKTDAKHYGVEYHASVFDEEVRRHSFTAIIWLAVAIIAFIMVIAAIICSFDYTVTYLSASETPSNGAVTFGLISSKVLLFSTLLYLLSNCVKMYKVHVNQQLINRGKANALRTFYAFVSNTSDESIKSAVLLQTTSTIFGPLNTGLTQGDSVETQINLNPADLIKGVNK